MIEWGLISLGIAILALAVFLIQLRLAVLERQISLLNSRVDQLAGKRERHPPTRADGGTDYVNKYRDIRS